MGYDSVDRVGLGSHAVIARTTARPLILVPTGEKMELALHKTVSSEDMRKVLLFRLWELYKKVESLSEADLEAVEKRKHIFS